jgi:hypothetical protein
MFEQKTSHDALRRGNMKLGDIADAPAKALNRIFSLESSDHGAVRIPNNAGTWPRLGV